MGCEMDTAFVEAYTGEGTPFGPTALLLSMWKASAELAGHEQQGGPFLLPCAETFWLMGFGKMRMRFSWRR
jgi:hypothetical protein